MKFPRTVVLLTVILSLLFHLEDVTSQQSAIVWQQDYSDSLMCSRDEIEDALIDSAGNIFLTGTTERSRSNFDITTLKLNQNGSLLWKDRYSANEPKITSFDKAFKMLKDEAGNTIICGNSLGNSSSEFYSIIKYDPSGKFMWEVHSPTDMFCGEIKDMALDRNGDIYVSGRESSNYFLIKYSSQGNLLWKKKLTQFVNTIKCDHTGNIYSFGRNASTDLVYFVTKYNGQGTEILNLDTLISIQYALDPNFILDESGDFFISGIFRNYNYQLNHYQSTIFTRKYNQSGTLLWEKRFSDPKSIYQEQDHLIKSTLDLSGNLWLGYNINVDDEGHNTYFKCIDPKGVTQKEFSYNSPWNNNDYLIDFDFDGNSNLVATGIIFADAYNSVAYVRKIDQNGIDQWGNIITDDNYLKHYPVKLLVDKTNDNIYVFSNFCNTKNFELSYFTDIDFAVYKYSANGIFEWNKIFSDEGTSYVIPEFVSTDSKNNIYSGGTSQFGPAMEYPKYLDDRDFLFLKYSLDGRLLWSRRYDNFTAGEDKLFTMFTTDTDELIAIGRNFNDGKLRLLKYSPEGNLISDLSDTTTVNPRLVCRDSSRGVFYVLSNRLLVKYNENFEIIWAKTIEIVSNIYIDPEGNIYATQFDNLYKYDLNAVLLWSKKMPYEDFRIFDIAFSENRLYLCGVSRIELGHDRAMTSCYTTNGNLVWQKDFDGSDYGKRVWLQKNNDVFVFANASNSGSYLLKYTSEGQNMEVIKYGFHISSTRIDKNNNFFVIDHDKVIKFCENGKFQFSRQYVNDTLAIHYGIHDIAILDSFLITTGDCGNLTYLHSHKWHTFNTICFSQRITSNRPPQILETPPQYAEYEFYYHIKTFDPDRDPVLMRISGAPPGLKFTDYGYMKLGYVTRGTFPITLIVTDIYGLSDTLNYNLVLGPDNPPVIYSKPDSAIRVGQLYLYAVDAADPENDFINYQLTSKPSWLTVDQNTGLITGTPPASDEGKTFQVSLKVYESLFNRETVQSYPLKVYSPNKAPVFTSKPDTAAHLFRDYSYSVRVNDENNDPVKLKVQNLPKWLQFDSINFTISGSPTRMDYGKNYNIQIVATDNFQASAIQSFNLLVDYPENKPPVINSEPVIQGFNSFLYYYQLTVLDENPQILLFKAEFPSWLKIDIDGLISGCPTLKDTGIYTIQVTVTDEYGATANQIFNLQISASEEAVKNKILYEISPNPVYYGMVNFEVQSPSEISLTLELLDNTGSTITTIFKNKKIEGYFSELVKLPTLASGVYYFRISQNGQSTVKRILVLKKS